MASVKAFVLLMVTLLTFQASICIGASEVDLWKLILPNIPIPAPLTNPSTTLAGSTLQQYISQISGGQLASVPEFCVAAGLYCSDLNPTDVCLRISFRYKFSTYRILYFSYFNLAASPPTCPVTTDAISGPPIFFHESSLFAPTITVPDLRDTSPPRALIPKQLENAFPKLSSGNLPRFLHLFNTTTNSSLGGAMELTLSICSDSSGGCVASLGDYISLNLPQPYRGLYYNDIEGFGVLNNAKVLGVESVRISGSHILACHPFVFPFQVFFCHKFSSLDTALYKVEVEASDNLFVICHRNTTGWDQNHIAFKELESSPGNTDACHFVFENEMVWY